MQRQRVLLYLIGILESKGKFSKTIADKTLFLLSKECGFNDKISFYSFYPYEYGPFSELYYYDLRRLDRDGCLKCEILTEKGKKEAEKLDKELKSLVSDIIARFDGKNLIEYIYGKYPDYTVKSKLSSKIRAKPKPGFYSIGYEGKNIDSFLDILIRNGIEVLIDVRANPFSMNFVFTGKKLKEYLKKVGIDYIHLPELGINGNLRKGLETKEDYAKLFEHYQDKILTKANLGKIILEGKEKRIAIMCMEKDHESCHRGIIASELEKMEYEVIHL